MESNTISTSTKAPEWETSDEQNGKRLKKEFLEAILVSDEERKNGTKIEKIEFHTTKEMMSEIIRISVTFNTNGNQVSRGFIWKQLPASKYETSKLLGLTREAFFYKSELHASLNDVVAKCYYSYGNEATGEKYILMDWIEGVSAGFLYGPENPNNWAKQAAGELEAIIKQNLTDANISIVKVTEEAAIAAAKIHTKYWNNTKIFELPWMRGREWWNPSETDVKAVEEKWHGVMILAKQHWDKYLASGEAKTNPLDPHFVELINASFNKISFKDYHDWTLRSRSHFTVVQGDCHPGNMMWTPAHHIKLVDWEMVGIGQGTQEIGQFMISHLDPKLRLEHEKYIVRVYYDELIKQGVPANTYSWEACWNDYVVGGAGRWVWFIGWMSTALTQYFGFFVKQVSAFLNDHKLTPETIPQPRI